MIDIYIRPISSFDLDIDKALLKLPISIQKHILKRKKIKRQMLSLAGYSFLASILKESYQSSIAALYFTKAGKPLIANTNINFSISHSKNLLGIAITTEGQLGLDIEDLRIFEKPEVAFSFFSKAEQDQILAATSPPHTLINFWSKKEAFVKTVGGRMFDIAALTNVCGSTMNWEGKEYFFYPISYDFDGFIWVAASFYTTRIRIQNQE